MNEKIVGILPNKEKHNLFSKLGWVAKWGDEFLPLNFRVLFNFSNFETLTFSQYSRFALTLPSIREKWNLFFIVNFSSNFHLSS